MNICLLLSFSTPLRRAQAITLFLAAVFSVKLLMSVSPGGLKLQNSGGTRHAVLSKPECCVLCLNGKTVRLANYVS